MSDETRVEAPEVETGHFAPAVLALSKTDRSGPKPVRVFDQFVTYGQPTLADCHEEFPVPDYWVMVEVQGADKDDVQSFAAPRYEDSKLQALQDALSADHAGNARNAAKADSPEFSFTWEEYFSKKDSGTFGKVLAQWKRGLGEYLAATGKYSAEQSATIISLMDSRKVSQMGEDKKAKLLKVVNDYVEALENPDEVRSATNSMVNALTKETEDLGFL